MLWTLAAVVPSSVSFLLMPSCQAPPPCSCNEFHIFYNLSCDGLNLTVIPEISENTDIQIDGLLIYLDNNAITNVGANAFQGFELNNVSEARLYMSNNNIRIIDNQAFVGIENAIQVLDLNFNNLTVIPEAVGTLTNLQELHIRQNPLISLATTALPSLSRTLTIFWISMDNFQEWPKELHYFRLLSEFHIDGYMLTEIPFDAFSGFNSSLTKLEISRTALDGIPLAGCRLQRLQYLTYNNNLNTTSPIFGPCEDPLASVTSLTLQNNNLQGFPNIFRYFPVLQSLDLSKNFIHTIDSTLIPEDQPLQSLYVNENRLHRIPSVQNRFPNLVNLELQHNDIDSIEDFDLFKLAKLRRLDISNNPLKFVSNDAFQSQEEMNTIDFSYTELKEIPRAITALTSIGTLDLTGSPIDCTCSMTYIRNSEVTISNVDGTCEGTGENITYFQDTVLPHCV